MVDIRRFSGWHSGGSALGVNKYYDRYILSSYGVLQIPVSYWECASCESFYCPDDIAGVTGSNNR